MLLKHVRETEASPGLGSSVHDLNAYADSLDRECRRLHAGFRRFRRRSAAFELGGISKTSLQSSPAAANGHDVTLIARQQR